MSRGRNQSLQSFSSDGEDVILSLAVSWAGAVLEQLDNVKKRVAYYNDIEDMYERANGDVTIDTLAASWQAAWVAEALLVISADNLERWIKRLYRERDREPAAAHPQLRALRNAIEHMDESDFEDDKWIARAAGSKQNRGLGSLPDASLSIAVGSHGLVFGLISHADLRDIVDSLIHELEQELDDYAKDMYNFHREDR